MRRTQSVLLAVSVVVATSCESPVAPHPLDNAAASTANDRTGGASVSTNGGGRYLLSNTLDIQFAFSATQNNGGAHGQFHQQLTLDGLSVDFRGRVTCVTVDPILRRAWIGGIITKNASEHPNFQTLRHQVGHDIWFRVLDNGEGSAAAPDRTTFVGFEGDRNIPTSAEYCAAKLWLDGDANTWPVTSGNIQVRP